MNKGLLYGAVAYAIWGLLPLYWKALHGVSALEILAHRIVWALAVAVLLVALRRSGWGWLRTAARSPRVVGAFALSAVLLSVNWGIYIWAVNAGHVVETSLGYFINPLANVLLGVLFLRERLRLGQALAVLTALAGVLYLTLQHGSPPWIALALASSFALYGLLRKTAALGSLEGLTLETLLMTGPALAYIAWAELSGAGAFLYGGPLTSLLLVGAGAVTAVPLLLFAAGARRVTLTTMGILQYIAPTLQFALGVTVFGEPLTSARLIGFGLVWAALVIYTLDGTIRGGRAARARANELRAQGR
jgi:chloramphenicol-sensitive protein RarD